MSGVQPSMNRAALERQDSLLAVWRERSQIDFELEFFEKLAARSPKYVEVLRCYAELLGRQGRFERAVAVDRELTELLPDDCIAAYNYACSLARVGRPEEAVIQLKSAVELGYRDRLHLEADRDLESVRGLPAYREVVRRLRVRESVE